MGCDSSGSNFNNEVYQDGKWWATGGWDFSFEAEDLDIIIDRIRARKQNPRRDYTYRYNWKRLRWVATPVNPPQPW